MAATRDVTYELLFDKIEEKSGDTQTFYDEGYRSMKRANEAMEHLHNRVTAQKREGFRLCNFRIVRHEVVDRKTVVKKFKKWDEPIADAKKGGK